MQNRSFIVPLVILLAATMLAGCGAAPTMEAAATVAPAAPAATVAPAVQVPAAAAAPTSAIINTGQGATTSNVGLSPHLIVKDGSIDLLVKDTDVASSGVTQIVGDTQGYIINSHTWYQDYYGKNYKYATYQIGVPVDQFEITLHRLRDLAVRVTNENETGQDVTDQYVDLQSQLVNLEATRDRIRGFLNQATNVDDALKINQQLSDVEGQIEQIQGKINYLSNRSAFSTITINLSPDLPPVVSTPTPIPTPVPVEGLAPWDPGRTTQQASQTLVSTYRAIVDVLIWIFVVFVPIVGPPVLIVWLIMWFVRRRKKSTLKS